MVAGCGGDIIVAAYPEGKPPLKKFMLMALAGVFAVTAASAAEVASLYTAQVPIDNTKPDPRAHAYDTALAQVLLRVSGAGIVNDVVLFDTLFPEPDAYVVQFRQGAEDTLFVSFDGDAIEQVLRRAGQPVWGGDRPLTLVWLAVDWGQGNRDIIGAADDQENPDASRSINSDHRLRERMLEIAELRGLPIVFPLLDSEDRVAVSFSDIWGGFDERVIAASQRYEVNSILIGRVRADGRAQNRWSYYFGDQQRSWSGAPEVVVAQVSDLLAAEFSIGGDEPLRRVQLNISGITTIDEYGEMQSVLADISLVEDFSVSEVSGDRISFVVDAHGGATRLARALRFAGLIEQERIDMGDFGTDEPVASLEFFLSE